MKTKILAIATVIILSLSACGGRNSQQETNCCEHDHCTTRSEMPNNQETLVVESGCCGNCENKEDGACCGGNCGGGTCSNHTD